MATYADLIRESTRDARRREMTHDDSFRRGQDLMRNTVTESGRRARKVGGAIDDALASVGDALLPRADLGSRYAVGYDEPMGKWEQVGDTPEAAELKTIGALFPTGSLSDAAAGGKAVLRTFGGMRAKTADLEAQKLAEALEAKGVAPEKIWQETGWYRAPWDDKWRFEIDDSQSKIKPTLQTLKNGGYEAREINTVDYLKNPDGTYELTLAPRNPQTTKDFINLYGMNDSMLRSVLPEYPYHMIRKGNGEESFMRNFQDSKQFELPFKFEGINALPVDEAIQHPELFGAYPSLTDALVQVNPNLGISGSLGRTDAGEDILTMGLGQQRSTGLHELQHAIQEREGFARGGSPQWNNDAYNLMREKYPIAFQEMQDIDSQRDMLNILNPDDLFRHEQLGARRKELTNAVSRQAYENLAGEAEARAVQARMNLTPEQRRARFPLEDFDVKPEDMIVRYGDGLAMSMPVDYGRLPIGAPELKTASIGDLHDALASMRARNTGKGLDEDMATGAIRDEIARRNAVEMLGLPEGNTAADRAWAMGFEDDVFHGTKRVRKAFKEMDGSKRKDSTTWNFGGKDPTDGYIFASNDPGVAGSYAGVDPWAIKPKRSAIYPLKANMSGAVDYYPDASLMVGPGWEDDMANLGHEWTGVIGDMANVANLNNGAFRAHDVFDGATAFAMGTPQTTYGIKDPSRIRSRFAAFDPKLRDSPNLLAANPYGLSPYALVGEDDDQSSPLSRLYRRR